MREIVFLDLGKPIAKDVQAEEKVILLLFSPLHINIIMKVTEYIRTSVNKQRWACDGRLYLGH